MAAPNQLPTNLIVSPQLTAIAVAYENSDLIADQAAPRVQVDTPDFKYTVRNKSDGFSIPETLVGRKGYVNEIEVSEDQLTASVEDHFLDGAVPRRDIRVAQAYNVPVDPMERMTEAVTKQFTLAHESRVATVITDPSNYATGNKVTLSGNSQWSDFEDSDPMGAILDVFDTMLVRPTVGVVGRLVASKLVRHPKIVQAWHANDGGIGVAPLSFLADQLGLKKLLVGDSWYNSGAPGQAANIVRLWGKSASFYYQDPVTVDTDAMSMFITAEWDGRFAATYFDEKRGGRGSYIVRVGEATKVLCLAPDLGYLFQNAVA